MPMNRKYSRKARTPECRGRRVPSTSGGASRISAVAARLMNIRPNSRGTALLIL